MSREAGDAAPEFGLRVRYDIVGEVSVLESLADQYPAVDFIIPPQGSFAGDWGAQLALINYLVRHPNLHADMAGVRRFDLLEQGVQRAGAAKLLFGSEGPMAASGGGVSQGALLRLSPRGEALVLGGNVLRRVGRVTSAARHAAEHAESARPGRSLPSGGRRAANCRLRARARTVSPDRR